MEELVETLEDILPDKTEYVAQAWGAVYFSTRGYYASVDTLEDVLEEKGFVVDIFEDSTSPQVRVELKDTKRRLEEAEDLGANAAYDRYKNTREGEYVPSVPMEPDYERLERFLERKPSNIERKTFKESYEKEAKQYNIEIEVYGGKPSITL